MESIFLALSGVILLAGVLYWFWSHIQLTQKKVQLLENAVFELRGMLQRGGFTGGGTGGGSVHSDGSPDLPSNDEAPSPPGSPYVPVSSMYNDLSDDDWKEDAEVVDHEGHADVSAGSTSLSALGLDLEESSSEEINPDLQPGGRIQGVEEIGSGSGSGSGSELGPTSEQFRDLFTSPPTSVTEATSLDAMPVKDLRRLAEQRGIANASELRKKEILSALKAQIGSAGGSNGPSTVVQLEKTLDLTEVAEILE